MKKTELLLTLAAILFSANIYAISHYKKGDSLYVWASKGLQLRTEDDFKSEIICLIDFGELVIANEKKEFYSANYRPDNISVIEIQSTKINNKYYPNFRLTGKWCEVTYKGKKGYVFDAYLSSLKVIHNGEGPKKYFDRTSSVVDTIFYEQKKNGQETEIIKLIYDSGVAYFKEQGVSYGIETIAFPYSFEESYLFFISRYINKDEPYFDLYSSDNNKTIFVGSMEKISLTKLNGFVIVENEWGN